jgi:hypothetical protein
MAQAARCQPLVSESWVPARVSPCWICHLDRFVSEFFCFPLSVSFHRGSPYLRNTWGMNSGRSSETQSHPIDMKDACMAMEAVDFSPPAQKLRTVQSEFRNFFVRPLYNSRRLFTLCCSWSHTMQHNSVLRVLPNYPLQIVP